MSGPFLSMSEVIRVQHVPRPPTPSSCSIDFPVRQRIPGAGLSCAPCVVREVPWLAAERALNASVRWALRPSRDLSEQVGQEGHVLGRYALLGERGRVLVHRYRRVPDLAACRLADLRDCLREGE